VDQQQRSRCVPRLVRRASLYLGGPRWEYCRWEGHRWPGCGIELNDIIPSGEVFSVSPDERSAAATEHGPNFALLLDIIAAITRGEWTHLVSSKEAVSWTPEAKARAKLEDELFRYGLAGFRRIRAAHAKERFYSFAFYTNGEYNYVALTASTLEGLEAVAQAYKEKPSYKAMSIEDLKLDLKWSPCDSPLHGAAEDVLTAVDPLMQALATDGTSFDWYVFQVRLCFANALKRIDAEGVFGRGENRKKVVVNLLMGDQSDEDRINFAERVNPSESVKMLKQDLKAASRLRR